MTPKETKIANFAKKNGNRITTDQCFELPGIVDGIPDEKKRAYSSSILTGMRNKGLIERVSWATYQLVNPDNKNRMYNEKKDIIFF